jgi:lysophospholipase L1-like esterase
MWYSGCSFNVPHFHPFGGESMMAAPAAMVVTFGNAPISVMPFGDSITAGYDGTAFPGYRQYLLNDLTTANITTQYVGSYDPTTLNVYGQHALGYSPTLTSEGQNFVNGFPGYSSADLLANIAGVYTPPQPQNWPFIGPQGGYWLTGGNGTGRLAMYPDVVLLMCGTNDFYENITPAQTEANVAAMINWFAVNRQGTSVIVASPPASLAAGIAPDVSADDMLLKQDITPTNFPNAEFVDVYQSFLNPDGSVNGNMLSNDGVHPSDQGYQAIATDFDTAIVSSGVAEVPEPSSITIGLLGLLGRRRLRRKIKLAINPKRRVGCSPSARL